MSQSGVEEGGKGEILGQERGWAEESLKPGGGGGDSWEAPGVGESEAGYQDEAGVLFYLLVRPIFWIPGDPKLRVSNIQKR